MKSSRILLLLVIVFMGLSTSVKSIAVVSTIMPGSSSEIDVGEPRILQGTDSDSLEAWDVYGDCLYYITHDMNGTLYQLNLTVPDALPKAIKGDLGDVSALAVSLWSGYGTITTVAFIGSDAYGGSLIAVPIDSSLPTDILPLSSLPQMIRIYFKEGSSEEIRTLAYYGDDGYIYWLNTTYGTMDRVYFAGYGDFTPFDVGPDMIYYKGPQGNSYTAYSVWEQSETMYLTHGMISDLHYLESDNAVITREVPNIEDLQIEIHEYKGTNDYMWLKYKGSTSSNNIFPTKEGTIYYSESAQVGICRSDGLHKWISSSSESSARVFDVCDLGSPERNLYVLSYDKGLAIYSGIPDAAPASPNNETKTFEIRDQQYTLVWAPSFDDVLGNSVYYDVYMDGKDPIDAINNETAPAWAGLNQTEVELTFSEPGQYYVRIVARDLPEKWEGVSKEIISEPIIIVYSKGIDGYSLFWIPVLIGIAVMIIKNRR